MVSLSAARASMMQHPVEVSSLASQQHRLPTAFLDCYMVDDACLCCTFLSFKPKNKITVIRESWRDQNGPQVLQSWSRHVQWVS